MQTKEISLYIGDDFIPFATVWHWKDRSGSRMKDYNHPTAASIMRIMALGTSKHHSGNKSIKSFVVITARTEKE